MSPSPRRMVIFIPLAAIIVLLTTAHYFTSPNSSLSTKSLGKLASNVGQHVQELLHTGGKGSSWDETWTSTTEKGSGGKGKHFHVRPSPLTSKQARIDGCDYPILIHVTPDRHCTGALALYGSIVRNVLLQPNKLKNRTCVHVTYVEPTLETIESMYSWPARGNPFTHVEDCKALDTTPAYNEVVPIQWQALKPIDKPSFMTGTPEAWLAALNKVHSWGFDVYPRILLLDADSIILIDLANIFEESDPQLTILGALDQYASCHDVRRLNGGMILLRPSRYFHIVATELLYDRDASVSGRWAQSEQELLNCICGYSGETRLLPEVQCGLMPMYNSVWPQNYGCSVANVVPMRSIHFTSAMTKPWLIEEEKLDLRFDTAFWRCVRDATRGGHVYALVNCAIPELEVTREVKIGR
jgi:hypothetical protein